jgi:hypothetical protein
MLKSKSSNFFVFCNRERSNSSSTVSFSSPIGQKTSRIRIGMLFDQKFQFNKRTETNSARSGKLTSDREQQRVKNKARLR